MNATDVGAALTIACAASVSLACLAFTVKTIKEFFSSTHRGKSREQRFVEVSLDDPPRAINVGAEIDAAAARNRYLIAQQRRERR